MRTLCPLVLCLASTVKAAVAGDHGTASVQRPLQLSQQDSLPAEADPKIVLGLDPMRELRNALHVMQDTWFALYAGTWPSGIDWTRAVLDTHLIASAASLSRLIDQPHSNHSQRRELENEMNKYFTQNIAYYFGEDDFAIRYQAYDDMLWVVLGWLESIRFIKAQSVRYHKFVGDISESSPWYGEQFISTFAHRAESFWNLTTRGWDTRYCGGGMVWNPRLAPYKNAITNQLFISASVGMYLYFPGRHRRSTRHPGSRFDSRHLTAAIVGYDWLKNSGMINRKGLYVDGFHVRNWRDGGTECDQRNEMVYTYNQGVLISGLRGLWEATGNVTYLADGHELARNAMRATGWAFEGEDPPDPGLWEGLGRNGILEDRCDAYGNCNQDGQTFKGIFMHHLALLCEPLPLAPVAPEKTFAANRDLYVLHRESCKQYSKWVEHNAKAVLGTQDEHQRFGGWWGAHPRADTVPVQPNAIDYRNNASELLQDLWTLDSMTGDSAAGDKREQQPLKPESMSNSHVKERPTSHEALQDRSFSTADLNDRGRGRTVETHSGGVAILRALWELSNTE